MIVVGEEELICVQLGHGKGCEERLVQRVDVLGTWWDCPRCGMSFLRPSEKLRGILRAQRRGERYEEEDG